MSHEWKLVLVGDAAMHPAELLGAGDWDYYSRGGRSRSGDARDPLDDAARGLLPASRVAEPRPAELLARRDGGAASAEVFSMFPLTLDGLGDAIGHLSKGDVTKKR